ncbi:hypothetical protein SNEBB_000287, partial [Seison nebaliae]
YKISTEEVLERICHEKEIYRNIGSLLTEKCLGNITTEKDNAAVNRLRIRENTSKNFSVIERRRLSTYTLHGLHFHANTSYFMSTFHILHMKKSFEKNYEIIFPSTFSDGTLQFFQNLQSLRQQMTPNKKLENKFNKKDLGVDIIPRLTVDQLQTPTKCFTSEINENSNPSTPNKVEMFDEDLNSVCTFYSPIAPSNKTSTKRRIGKVVNVIKNVAIHRTDGSPINNENISNSANKRFRYFRDTQASEKKKTPRVIRDINNVIKIGEQYNLDSFNEKLLSIISSMHLDCSSCFCTTRVFIKNDWGKIVLAFDIEIVQMSNNSLGLKGKRVIGDVWNYKATFNSIIEKLDI